MTPSLSDVNDYPLEKDIYKNIKSVKAKPFDMNFDKQLDALENRYSCCLKFSFTKTDVYDLMDSLKDVYDYEIIRRVEKIILEQMRKYPVFFG